VSPLELFFDLGFVFAVSQLSNHLLTHLSGRGAAETAVLVVAMFTVWAVVSFGTTLLDVTRSAAKVTLIVVMGLVLFMNAGISQAFGRDAWTFSVPFLVVLLGYDAVTAVIAPTDLLRHHYQREMIWNMASAPLWVVGAAGPSDTRLWWWSAGAVVNLFGVCLAHPLPGRVLRSQHLPFDADHMRERLRLFLIILLGETVLTIGRVISNAPTDPATVLASVAVFAALVCLWATYFAGGEDLFARHVLTTIDPIRAVRVGINVTYGALAGLVATAVGSDLAIARPLGHGSARVGLFLFGGIALYLAAQGWSFRATVGDAWAERFIAVIAVTAAGAAAVQLPPLASLAVLDAVLTALVLTLLRVHKRLAEAPPPAASR
jgi:low temperature requirement protein LtrA